MESLDLNALLLFQKVVDAGSLTRAATATRLSIATISRRLSALERQLGSALLERNARRLSPTPLGRTILERCRRIDGEVSAALDLATEARSGLGGTLRVSLPAEFGQAWLGRATAAFLIAHPDVVLDIHTNEGTIDFARDECDLAIVLREPPNSRLVRRRLTSLRRGLFAAPAYLDANGMPSSLEDLTSHACLVTELQREIGVWTFSQKRRQRSFEPKWRATVANIGMLRELVVGGAGIGMLNDILCRNDVRSGRLVRLFPDWEGPPLHATAVIPGHRMISRRSRAFLDFIARDMGS